MGRKKSTSKTYYQRHREELLKKASEQRALLRKEQLPKVYKSVEEHKTKLALALQQTTIDFTSNTLHLPIGLQDFFRPCVYVFYDIARTPIYIGSSSQGFMRVFSYRYDKYVDRRYLTECRSIVILWHPTIEEAQEVEESLIDALQPRYNKRGVGTISEIIGNTLRNEHSVPENDNG